VCIELCNATKYGCVCVRQMNKIGVTEHIEADECKFALWEGTVAPISDYKLILRVFFCAVIFLNNNLNLYNSDFKVYCTVINRRH